MQQVSWVVRMIRTIIQLYFLPFLQKTVLLYFSSYGYTDNTGATEVIDEIIARYNRALKLADKKILREAYSVSSTGIKFFDDSTYYPKGTKLSDFLSSFADSY